MFSYITLLPNFIYSDLLTNILNSLLLSFCYFLRYYFQLWEGSRLSARINNSQYKTDNYEINQQSHQLVCAGTDQLISGDVWSLTT